MSTLQMKKTASTVKRPAPQKARRMQPVAVDVIGTQKLKKPVKPQAGKRVFVTLKNAGYGAMMRQVHAGLPVAVVDDAVDYLHVTKGELIDILSLKPSSLSTWAKKPQALLPQQESDRVARIARVTGVVEQMIGDRESAVEWLNTPVPALGSQKPISLLGSDAGAKLVEDTLFRSLAGVYA